MSLKTYLVVFLIGVFAVQCVGVDIENNGNIIYNERTTVGGNQILTITSIRHIYNYYASVLQVHNFSIC